MAIKGGYKQKIKTLSENNKALVEALENYRYKCSEKEKTLIQVSTAALQNSISAKAKLNKLAKNLKEFLQSVEEIISLMNTNSSAYPTMFVQNMKPKKPRDCLSKLIESISEETSSESDDFLITKPPSSLGENGSCMEKGNTKSSSLIPTKIFTKSKKINQKKIPSIQKQSKAKVLETPSESLLGKQDFSSDIPKPLPSNKRCRNLSEVQLHQDISNHTTRKKQKLNPLCESEKTIKKNKHQTINLNPEPSVDKILPDPVIYVINTDQPQANLQDVTVEEFYSTNVLDKPHEDIALQKNKVISKKSKIKLDSKAGKTNRHSKKNNDENPSNNIISSHSSKRTKILAKPLKPQVNKDENKSETNIKVTSFDEKKCFEKSNVSKYLDRNDRALQETIGSSEQLPNKQILCSVENIPCDEAMKITVTAEIHKPPSDKLAEKKKYSSNIPFKIMQPRVVLSDIRETSLWRESGEGDCFVEVPFLRVQNKEGIKNKTKLKLTGRKNYKTRGSLPSHPKSLRSCRSKPVISYKENNLNKKMRRS